MNREPKYRIWDDMSFRFLVPKGGSPLQYHDHCVMYHSPVYYTLSEALQYERFHAQQYAGYVDKNGKEVYEGDYVKYKYLIGTDKSDFDFFVEEVKFVNSAFTPRPIENSYSDAGSNIRAYDFEIVGNIFENKDYLK